MYFAVKKIKKMKIMDELKLVETITKIESELSELRILKKEVLTLSEACFYIQVSASYIYKLTSKGQIPHYCPNGKRLYFKRSELDEWLTRNPKTEVIQEDIDKAAADYLILHPKRKGVVYE